MANKKPSPGLIVRYAVCSKEPGNFVYLCIDENSGRIGSVGALREAKTFITAAEARGCLRRYISWSMDISSRWKVVKISTTIEDA